MPQTKLDKLLEQARCIKMSDEDKEKQRRSFAFGNAHLANSRITRKMIDEAAERIKRNVTD